MTEEKYIDPMDDAMSDDPARGKWWGRLTFESFYCVFLQEDGKWNMYPYDPQVHNRDDRRTAINLTIEPLDPTRPLYTFKTLKGKRSYFSVMKTALIELAQQISEITQTPIDDNFNAMRLICGLWAYGSRVLNPDNKKGQTYTMPKPEMVFADETECQAHYEKTTGRKIGGSPVEDLPFMPAKVKPQPKVEPKPQIDPEREQYAKFLPGLWAQAGQDKEKLARLLQEMGMSKFFNLESPEVKAVTG